MDDTCGDVQLLVWLLSGCAGSARSILPDYCGIDVIHLKAAVHVAPLSCQGPGHLTALHRAAMAGNSNAMAALIQGGCAVDLQGRDGNSALHEVSWHGFSHCIKLLVKSGADVHIRNKAGNTALHLACQNAHAQTARLLLLGGSTPDTKNDMGDSCLHVAARYDNLTLVKILLGSLCSVTERNQAGDTALHVAAALNHKKTVRLLLKAGTDGTLRNNAGKTALDKARDNNHKDMAHLLARAPQVSSSVVEEDTPSSEQMESRTAFKPLNENDKRKGENDFARKKNLLWKDGEDSVQNGKTYQLYTLYRDKEGNIRQAAANGCLCKPLLKKLEGQLKATQQEMRLHVLNVQEQVNIRLGKMDHRNRHQAGVSSELKRWCVSQLKDRDVHILAKSRYYKLLPSRSVEQSVAEADLESLPLLSVVSGDSSTSLATYVNILPCTSTHSLGGPEQEQMGDRTYFEMKVDRSPDDYENTTLFPMPANHTSDFLLASLDPLWQPPGVQDSPIGAVMALRGEGFSSSSSSSSQSSINAQGPRLIHHQEHRCDSPDRKHFGELMSACRRVGIHTEGTRTLEFFIDRPTEPTFSQERNNQHAIEVTQRFFDSVSTQLERWYERTIAEVEQQTKLRAQQDQKELLQQISTLEEELQRLKTNEKGES
ncbi:ankyrin repeat domain-containing protein 6 [Anarrhichthys ocellatus]|uniref:ankyrin repeat domain-containing protein 6 n=1 Tax=Anarrhichthys ocellatus TaxID=433405 RepID=UPI0012EDA2C6|nr:ankyrin repeat domain-containing protein 6-like [Anarrhichthys ocellatus]